MKFVGNKESPASRTIIFCFFSACRFNRTTATWIETDDEGEEQQQTATTESSRTKRRDRGFYPWLGVGAEIPIGDWSSLTGQTHVLVEAEYEWEKRFSGHDLGGLRLMAGLRFRY
jgi:hypothetical protein